MGSSRTCCLDLTTLKNRALCFDEIEKFWSMNTMCGRCEWNAGRIFLPGFLKSSPHVREDWTWLRAESKIT
jgi:hypothetical protein